MCVCKYTYLLHSCLYVCVVYLDVYITEAVYILKIIIEDASRVTAGPPSFDDCSRTVKISVSWKCYGTAPAHMLGKI